MVLTSGLTTGASDVGGDILLNAGSSSSGIGGDAIITSGSSGSSSGGAASVIAGSSSTGNGGATSLSGGLSTSAAGGNLVLQSGNGGTSGGTVSEPFTMEGEVEAYLNRLTVAMQASLKKILSDAVEKAANWEIDTPRHEWLFDYPAQLCITGTQIYWTDETQLALEEYEDGQEDSVKRYLQLCNTRLSALIQLVLGDLTQYNRTKIISLITMDDNRSIQILYVKKENFLF